MTSMKNAGLTNAVTDLGLGDDLQEQAAQQFNARKKKANQTAQDIQAQANSATSVLSMQTAAQSLLGGS
jgi:hypothetical protein